MASLATTDAKKTPRPNAERHPPAERSRVPFRADPLSVSGAITIYMMENPGWHFPEDIADATGMDLRKVRPQLSNMVSNNKVESHKLGPSLTRYRYMPHLL